LRLWSKPAEAAPITITLDEGAAAKPGALDSSLPDRPDVGFYGRDETLYALDRAFDTHRVVLLHAYAGSGKTATAAEFARWYALTGGVQGPVLFSSFEHHLPLARVLDKIGAVFGPLLEEAGVQWDAMTDIAERRHVALQVLEQVPVLWIWDNVEPITGFPAGTESEWSDAEQHELRLFLSAARDTKTKFLLTSRRDETAWLGDLPRRVGVPSMPMQERLQLAGAIAQQRGQRLVDLPDLTPLLRFTRGNPLTILVTVGEALRADISTPERLDAFVESVGAGEAAFEDEETEGRAKSLGASLSYGFGHAFSEDERKILALLHLFQGFIDVDALRFLGNPNVEWCVEAVRGLTRERGIDLLDRAAEVGLLTALGEGYYTIHPALPWYFRDLFDRDLDSAPGDADRARRAFVEAIGALGSYYFDRYNEGQRQVMSTLTAEEDNLLAAWRLARQHGWWNRVISTMQGLRTLYTETGRNTAWRRLVEAVVPEFVDPRTDAPLPGREEDWHLVMEYRVRLSTGERRWQDAERLQFKVVAWGRERASGALNVSPEFRDNNQRNSIRVLAVSLGGLANIHRFQDKPACVDLLLEALDLYRSIDDRQDEAVTTFNLGQIYANLVAVRNLDEAERWYRKSLELRSPSDDIGRSKSLGELGGVAYHRFLEARVNRLSQAELAHHLTEAARLYHAALEMLPATAITDRGITHNQLGNIYSEAGDIDRALYHYQQDIRYCEIAGDIFGAGQTRFNVASTLLEMGRSEDARTYADAALANFSTFADRAGVQIQQTQALIGAIDRATEQGGNT
jgi:tetratricopeptide (TPR) repeat protein